MAGRSVCSSCLRTLRQANRIVASDRIPVLSRVKHFQRSFTTSTPSYEDQSAKSPSTRSPPPPKPSSDAFNNFAAQLRNTNALRGATEPYVAYGGTEDLFQECTRQCSYTIPSALETPPGQPPMNESGDHLGEGSGWWLEPKSKGGLGLDVTFLSWAQVLFLHMWMVTVRLRGFPATYVKNWHQHLLDHFFYAAEDRMATWHGMAARSVRNKHLKDLWLQWRGVQLGYDEGLIKGDAVLATAIWRNVFKARENVDISDVAQVTTYVMRELQRLGNMGDIQIAEGRIKFADPRTVQDIVSAHHLSMKEIMTADAGSKVSASDAK